MKHLDGNKIEVKNGFYVSQASRKKGNLRLNMSIVEIDEELNRIYISSYVFKTGEVISKARAEDRDFSYLVRANKEEEDYLLSELKEKLFHLVRKESRIMNFLNSYSNVCD